MTRRLHLTIRLAVLVVGSAVASTAACGSDSDDRTNHVGPDAADMSTPSDGGAGDGGAGDGTLDVNEASSAPPLRPCAELSPPPPFCMDFDDGLTTAWKAGVQTTVNGPVDAPGSVAGLGSPGFTGPSDLHLTSDGQDGGQPSGDAYYNLYVAPGTRAHLRGALRITHTPYGAGAEPGSGYGVMAVQLFGVDEFHFVRADVTLSSSAPVISLNIVGTNLTLITKGPVTVPLPPAGQWAPFDVDLTVGPGGATTAKLTVGTATTLATATTTNAVTTSKLAVVGLAPIGSTAPATLDLDNLTYEP
jgi:hypothetical protein